MKTITEKEKEEKYQAYLKEKKESDGLKLAKYAIKLEKKGTQKTVIFEILRSKFMEEHKNFLWDEELELQHIYDDYKKNINNYYRALKNRGEIKRL